LRRKRRGMKINFHRVLLGFFENWDKSSQKKWDKGADAWRVDLLSSFLIEYPQDFGDTGGSIRWPFIDF
ncbi:MAG: hypothetical protein J6W10_04810, partial [Kiritimatiellae bacterium]|nr:hypothetical protein [Kiritimatiellia bacterium]